MCVEQATGLALVVVFGLWIAYVVPNVLRRRQNLKDSRATDRFSSELRVLKVANAEPDAAGADSQPAQSSSSAILTPPLGQATRPSRIPQGGQMTGIPMSPARRAQLERRAAAARRRAFLTFTLFLAVVVVSVVAATTALSVGWVAVPASLMVTVLGLGRRAVLANQRNDAAYVARQRKATYAPRQESPTERKLKGRPVSAVRTGETLQVSEDVSTTVISKVESSIFAKKHVTGRPVAPGIAERAESVARTNSVQKPERAASQQATQQQVKKAVSADEATSASTASGRTARTETPVPAPPAAGRTWSASAVPTPTYASKPAAPRWEAPGITTEIQKVTKARMEEIAREARQRELAGQTTAVQRDAQQTDAVAPASAQVEGVASESTVGAAVQDSGVTLNSILERRRAV